MRICRFLSIALFLFAGAARGAETPNILFIIADDASRHFGEAYDCDWVKTPNIDKLAEEGLVFDNAYVATAKCAPCRASTMTGRFPWQIEAGANHQNVFPDNYPAFGEVLQAAGIQTGAVGKTWGPGTAHHVDGSARDFGLTVISKKKVPDDFFGNFLKARKEGAPAFFYWHGSSDPHRGYQKGSGIAAGKKLSDIDHVPAYWPDNDIVRGDMLNYSIEVERFDTHVGELLADLEASGESENTLVIVTSDHGMPFPRVKGHTFDDAHRVPLVMRWPAGIKNPGRRVEELVSFVDFAATFIDLQQGDSEAMGMELSGKSLADLLRDEPSHPRDFVLIGRERNDVYARPGSPSGLGYPARGIRMGDYLYVHNFEPDRWPCGNIELGLRDTDRGPTKSFLMKMDMETAFWKHNFGKRPADMLFNVVEDPDCVANLATDGSQAGRLKDMKKRMLQELKEQGDPRALGNGEVFDNYPTVKPAPKGWETKK